MDLPRGKNAPKLPPKPEGGGAAARQRQFDLERGLDADKPDADKPIDANKPVPQDTPSGVCESPEPPTQPSTTKKPRKRK
jgi:hypothetical protein